MHSMSFPPSPFLVEALAGDEDEDEEEAWLQQNVLVSLKGSKFMPTGCGGLEQRALVCTWKTLRTSDEPSPRGRCLLTLKS